MKTCTSHTFNQYQNELSWTAKQPLTSKLVNCRDACGSLCWAISEGSSLRFLDVGQDANTVGGPRARARATHEHDRLVRFEQTSIVSEAHGEHQSIVDVLFPLGCLRLYTHSPLRRSAGEGVDSPLVSPISDPGGSHSPTSCSLSRQ